MLVGREREEEQVNGSVAHLQVVKCNRLSPHQRFFFTVTGVQRSCLTVPLGTWTVVQEGQHGHPSNVGPTPLAPDHVLASLAIPRLQVLSLSRDEVDSMIARYPADRGFPVQYHNDAIESGPLAQEVTVLPPPLQARLASALGPRSSLDVPHGDCDAAASSSAPPGSWPTLSCSTTPLLTSSPDSLRLLTSSLQLALEQQTPIVLRGGANILLPQSLRGAADAAGSSRLLSSLFESLKGRGVNSIDVRVSSGGVFERMEDESAWAGPGSSNLPPAVAAALASTRSHVLTRPATVTLPLDRFAAWLADNATKPFADPSLYAQYLPLSQLVAGHAPRSATLPTAGSTVVPPEVWDDLATPHEVLTRLMTSQAPLSPPGSNSLPLSQVWIGGSTDCGLHFDEYDNVMVVLAGQKDFLLFPPTLSRLHPEGHVREAYFEVDADSLTLAPRSPSGLADSTAMVFSTLDVPGYLDNLTAGASSDATSRLLPTHCSVGPGDVLFLPPYWWHAVSTSVRPNESAAIALNWWWTSSRVTKDFPCPTCPVRWKEK